MPDKQISHANKNTNECDPSNHTLIEKLEYSPVGWFLMMVGITAKPKKINYICKKCGAIFDEHAKNEETQ